MVEAEDFYVPRAEFVRDVTLRDTTRLACARGEGGLVAEPFALKVGLEFGVGKRVRSRYAGFLKGGRGDVFGVRLTVEDHGRC